MEHIIFVLDGSNLAALDKSKGHSLDTIASVRAALRKAYPECKIVTLVDASLRHRVERARFDEQESQGLLFSAPADEDADFFILSFARRRGAVVVTTDRYIGQAQRVGVPLLRPMLVDGEVFLGEPRVFRNVRGRRSEPFDLETSARAQPATGESETEESPIEQLSPPAPRRTRAAREDREEGRATRSANAEHNAPAARAKGTASQRRGRSSGQGRKAHRAGSSPPARAGSGAPRSDPAAPPRETPGEQPEAASAPGRGSAGRAGSPAELRPWREAVAPAVRRIRRAFGLKSPRGRARRELGREARIRRYAWLQDVLHSAVHAGLADRTHRRLLMAALPAEWIPYLPQQYPPAEQLGFDLCVLAHLPRVEEDALLPLSLWLRTAHVIVHPLRLATFFQDALEEHESSGAMPLSWLPFPDTPYELLDRAAYRTVQERRGARVPERSGNVRGEAAEPVGPPPAAAVERDTEGAEPGEACPYCGSRAYPLYDFYLGRSCIRCFIEREEALQEKVAAEQGRRRDPWSPGEPL